MFAITLKGIAKSTAKMLTHAANVPNLSNSPQILARAALKRTRHSLSLCLRYFKMKTAVPATKTKDFTVEKGCSEGSEHSNEGIEKYMDSPQTI
jgi:hypothetical protein